MNRRQLFTTLASATTVSQLDAQVTPGYRFHSGLVAYSYRKELAARTMSYEDLIRRIADWGLDGLDCTVYWFADTSPEYLASLRKAAFKTECKSTTPACGSNSPNPLRSCGSPSSRTFASGWMWPTGWGPATSAFSAATYPKVRLSSRRS